MYKILSIDGGGMRGIIPAMVLTKIEELTKKPSCEIFDLIAGTSTGGILTVGLTKPNEYKLPQYTAADLIELYRKEGKNIFSSTWMHKIRSVNGIYNAKYDSAGIDSVLTQYFGDSMLSDALSDVFITAYETELRLPFFFRSRLARDAQNNGYDFEMWKVIRSATAAPTYFQPYKLDTDAGKGYYSLIDGGVFANNPAMCAYVEAKSNYSNAGDVAIVSLGTGEFSQSIMYDEAKNWGLMKWAQPLVGISMDGVNDTVEFQLNQIMPANRHYRLQASLNGLGKDEMDNASDENIHALMTIGQKLVDENMENGVLPMICAAFA